jgi:hypothetical protein
VKQKAAFVEIEQMQIDYSKWRGKGAQRGQTTEQTVAGLNRGKRLVNRSRRVRRESRLVCNKLCVCRAAIHFSLETVGWPIDQVGLVLPVVYKQ